MAGNAHQSGHGSQQVLKAAPSFWVWLMPNMVLIPQPIFCQQLHPPTSLPAPVLFRGTNEHPGGLGAALPTHLLQITTDLKEKNY